jgi:hypothetical protein
LGRLNVAVAAANEAHGELVSRSKAVGLLLLEAKKLHPAVKDFEAYLKRVDGLGIARAYEFMRVAGGRTTDEELKKDARERQKKSRDKRKIPPKSKEPEPSFCDVTESLPKPKPAAQETFDSPQEAHDKARRQPKGEPLELGVLCIAWRGLELAAAAGDKAEVKKELKRLIRLSQQALKSWVLK